jgi:hypothetical protein
VAVDGDEAKGKRALADADYAMAKRLNER